LTERYKVRKFAFVDDEFFINKDRVESFCNLIIKDNTNIEWHASCRLNIIRNYSDELLDKIKASGCRSMNFGAESGSPEILDYINKDITVEDIVEGSRHAAENGIKSYMSFMSGFPRETIEDTLETKKIIDRLWRLNKRIVPNGIFPFNPYPGTMLFDEAVRVGGLTLPDNLERWGRWSFQYNAHFPWVSHKHAQMIKVFFCIVRLKFYLGEINDRPGFNGLFRILVVAFMSPWIMAGRLRWRYNFYTMPWEMDVWLFLMKKVFGFV
jgi:anaerobic magnesium-protoporphyrin IX monomethyl ester cyclase